ncbi:MAG: arginine--tRNA ligase [Deltaproteobacteria bacterium]|nr:arginine--tRNA ligase [Deltaproteobacteria bacterium]
MKSILSNIIAKHLEGLGLPQPAEIVLDEPKAKEHGDLSSNVALVLAKAAKQPPPKLAAQLAESLGRETEIFEKIEVKGPGFINFFLKPTAYHASLKSLWQDPNALKKLDLGRGTRVLVEFVSANPTGPMHVGHGRNAVVGDCISRLLEEVGFEVSREFYVNDHGVQIKTLGHSGCHYHTVMTEVRGVEIALPEDVYKGQYLEDLVTELKDRIAPIKHDPLAVGKLLGVELLETIKEELLRLNIVFSRYYSESSLYDGGKIDEALAVLRASGLTYEKEGALWFKTSEYGDDKDRVLIKSDNTYTYLTPDIAYHKDKFDRGYDLYLNVMGADHGGYTQRLKAAVAALGHNPDKLEFLLMQLVNLKRGGEVVNMSKRTGDYVTLHEVIDEVGKDAVRFFFMMRSHNATLDFDLELAKQQSSDNPVFYIQYAHARMSSIFRKAEEAGYPSAEALGEVDLTPLQLEEEITLIKTLLAYPEMLKGAVQFREAHRVAFYLLDLAKTFQNYYTRAKGDDRYRVLTPHRETTLAKLYLVKTLREVFFAQPVHLAIGRGDRRSLPGLSLGSAIREDDLPGRHGAHHGQPARHARVGSARSPHGEGASAAR